MAEKSGNRAIIMTILTIVGVLVLICGGIGIYVALQMKEVADLPEEEMAEAIAAKMGMDTSAENAFVEEFMVALREGRFEDASGMTTEAFQLSTGPDGLATLQERIDTVMGTYESKFLTNFNFNKKTVNGVAVTQSDVTYTGKFALGDGTITMRLIEQADGTLAIESFSVNSPRFTEGR